MGVKVMLNCRINDYNGAQVDLENAAPIPSDNVVWAAGIEAVPVPGLETAMHQPSGRLFTDTFYAGKRLRFMFLLWAMWRW